MSAHWSVSIERRLGNRRSRWVSIVICGVIAYWGLNFHWTNPFLNFFYHGASVLLVIVVGFLLAFSLYYDLLRRIRFSQERLNKDAERRVRMLVRTHGVMPMPPKLRVELPIDRSTMKRYDSRVEHLRTIPWGAVTPQIELADAARAYEETSEYVRTISGDWSKLSGPIDIYARMPAPWCWIGAARVTSMESYFRDNFYAPSGIRQALYYLAEAQAVDPDNIETLLLRTAYLLINGDPKRLRLAEKTLQRAQQLAPDHPRLPLAESRLFMAAKRYDLALQANNEAIRRAPTAQARFSARAAKAHMNYVMGKFGESATLYRELVNENDQDPWLWHNYSAALDRYQSSQEALYASDRALALMEFGAARSLNTRLRQRMGMLS